MNPFSPTRLRIVGLICAGVVIWAGFTEMAGRYSISKLQQAPLNLPVPVMQQSWGTSCGEAVIAMTYNYAHPGSPIAEPEVISYASANEYYTAGRAPYTSPANMVKIAKHYADDISTGTVIASGQGLSLLVQKLSSGEPVIIDVLSDFRDPKSEAHFIVVTGLSTDPSRKNAILVHYNDPFRGTQEAADWTGSEGVWHAWQANGDPGGSGWWLVIPPP